MPSVPLQSTLLAAAQYDSERQHLTVEFRDGGRYRFLQVPSHCYQQLLQAASKGRYFNRNIRNCLPYQRLSQLSTPIVLATPAKTK
jgi:hypothetical protein